MAQPSDEGLDDPLHGSSRDFDRLVDALHPERLLLLIERRLGAELRARVSADDILQDALLHAWRDRHAHRWSGMKAFRNWLLAIVDHRIGDARDHANAQKRGGGARVLSIERGPHADSADFDVPRSTTPSRIAWRREQAGVIRDAIEALPDDVRDVVRLRLVDQLPVETVARELGIGDSAVRHRFRRGAELFRRRIASALGSVERGETGKAADSSTLAP
jgi:RNA polymerase sigma factor (sigma-70 family)